MDAETILALTGFALAASWTPGPNNAMLAASGANFGIRRTLPHVAGIVLGFSVMVLGVAFGMGAAFERLPWLADALRWAGAAMLLWFAWRIATAAGGTGAARRARPFSLGEAASFQLVNPKAWTMCIAVTAQFAGPAGPAQESLAGQGHLGPGVTIALVFAVCGAASSLGWAGFGAALQRALARPGRLRVFNLAMAALIAGFVLMLLTGRI